MNDGGVSCSINNILGFEKKSIRVFIAADLDCEVRVFPSRTVVHDATVNKQFPMRFLIPAICKLERVIIAMQLLLPIRRRT